MREEQCCDALTGHRFGCRNASTGETGADRGARERFIDIVFDGPPGPESGRFIEVEDESRASVRFGEWIHRDDGCWALRIRASPPLASVASEIDAESLVLQNLPQTPQRLMSERIKLEADAGQLVVVDDLFDAVRAVLERTGANALKATVPQSVYNSVLVERNELRSLVYLIVDRTNDVRQTQGLDEATPQTIVEDLRELFRLIPETLNDSPPGPTLYS